MCGRALRRGRRACPRRQGRRGIRMSTHQTCGQRLGKRRSAGQAWASLEPMGWSMGMEGRSRRTHTTGEGRRTPMLHYPLLLRRHLSYSLVLSTEEPKACRYRRSLTLRSRTSPSRLRLPLRIGLRGRLSSPSGFRPSSRTLRRVHHRTSSSSPSTTPSSPTLAPAISPRTPTSTPRPRAVCLSSTSSTSRLTRRRTPRSSTSPRLMASSLARSKPRRRLASPRAVDVR